MKLLKIGHDRACDIVLPSNRVSALHAEITLLNNGDILLEDKNSLNGTYIQNQRIKPNKEVKISRGDAIRFADVELQWSQIPMPEDNSAFKGLYGIGTHFNNEFQISGATVSRYHATIKHGRDGKMYIVDHSKNGTTVDGTKIQSNSPVRIKKKSAVTCGGVPVDLSRLPWPSETWKYISGIAASAAIVIGLVFATPGIKEFFKKIILPPETYTDGELYSMYNKSVVYLQGVFHYKVTGLPAWMIDKYLNFEDFIIYKGELVPLETEVFEKLLKEDKLPNYSGTGFFISDDGKMITNLHIVKPWLFDNNLEKAESILKLHLQAKIDREKFGIISQIESMGDGAFVSQLKVEGVLDELKFIPNGKSYHRDNSVSCKVLSAGSDTNCDVAIIQSERGELPNGARCVNVKDSIDVSPEAITVGTHMYTMGYPGGYDYQISDGTDLNVYGQGGDVIRVDDQYRFAFNAASTHGASGSPIFSNKGFLIGVLDSGIDQTQGFNFGMKATHVKDILEKPFTK